MIGAFDAIRTVVEFNVGRRSFEQRRREQRAFLHHFERTELERTAVLLGRARANDTVAGQQIDDHVPGAQFDLLRRQAEHLRHQRGVYGFVALPVVLRDRMQQHLAVRRDAQRDLIFWRRATAGWFEKQSEADATQLAARICLCAARGERGPIALRYCLVDQTNKIARVVIRTRCVFERYCSSGNRVLAADRDAVQMQLRCRFIHQALDCIGHVGPAGAAIGGGGAGVGKHEAMAAIAGGDCIGAADGEAAVHGVDQRPGAGEIGALITQPVHPKRAESAVGVERKFRVDDDGAAMRFGHELLRARSDPFDWRVEFARGPHQTHVVHVSAGARAETTTDILRVNLHVAWLDTEDVAHAGP